MNSRLYSCCIAILLAFTLSACSHTIKNSAADKTPPHPVTPTTPAPVAQITVTPLNVERGQSAELSWNTQNATTITIDGIGSVSASGSQKITPANSTNYHLIATGQGGTAEANARITVKPKDIVSDLTLEQLFARDVKDLFFAYDTSDIRPSDEQIVAADAEFLKKYPNAKFVIQGHCDERGSEEYNLGLGESRAGRVREALLKQGISADRIRIISYGKEKPFCTTAENESCWQQNRRAHFVLQNSEQASAQ